MEEAQLKAKIEAKQKEINEYATTQQREINELTQEVQRRVAQAQKTVDNMEGQLSVYKEMWLELHPELQVKHPVAQQPKLAVVQKPNGKKGKKALTPAPAQAETLV